MNFEVFCYVGLLEDVNFVWIGLFGFELVLITQLKGIMGYVIFFWI